MKLLGVILSVTVVCLLLWFTWLFYGYFMASNASIKASLLGMGTAISAAIITHNYSQKREIRARHFLEKSKAYMHIFDLIFEVIRMTKESKELTEKQMIERSMEIKKSLMIWGDQNVLKAWMKFEEGSSKNPNEIITYIDNVIREIRKDLGHNDNKLETGDLFKLVIKAEDRKNN